ncbi:MAG: hypothetical protein O2798_10330, partial [Chloroflexi bacterium]|nr:hypothetical protein [Chloroflexota bacterium]
MRARIDALEAIAQLDNAHAARATLQALDRTVPFDWAAVVRFRPADGGAEAVAVYPSPMAGVAPGLRWQPLSATEARLRDTGQPALDNDVVFEGPGPLAGLAGYGFRARLLIPLHASDRVAGYAMLLRHRPHAFSPAEGVHAESVLRPLGPGVVAPMAEAAGTPSPPAAAPRAE